MINNWFGVHEGLVTAARVPPIARLRARISALELLLLLLCGAGAASASAFMRLGLRIPGSSIVLAVIPLVLGLAIAPRRLAGLIMSTGALATASAFTVAGMTHYGTGAIVSLCLTGPLMDLALARALSGWRLYAGLMVAGMTANVLALTSRGAAKILGLDLAGTRPFGTWWSQAVLTYLLCGAAAGLIGALCFFHLRNRDSEGPSAPTGKADEPGKATGRPETRS
jgi:hypothetical protein